MSSEQFGQATVVPALAASTARCCPHWGQLNLMSLTNALSPFGAQLMERLVSDRTHLFEPPRELVRGLGSCWFIVLVLSILEEGRVKPDRSREWTGLRHKAPAK